MLDKSIMLIGAVAGGVIGFLFKNSLGAIGILFGIALGAVSAEFFYNIIHNRK